MSGSSEREFRNLTTLPDWVVKKLGAQPETGMQFQTGDVILKDGSIICDVVFVGSKYISEVKGYDKIPFDPRDIKEIRLTHKKWGFR